MRVESLQSGNIKRTFHVGSTRWPACARPLSHIVKRNIQDLQGCTTRPCPRPHLQPLPPVPLLPSLGLLLFLLSLLPTSGPSDALLLLPGIPFPACLTAHSTRPSVLITNATSFGRPLPSLRKQPAHPPSLSHDTRPPGQGPVTTVAQPECTVGDG